MAEGNAQHTKIEAELNLKEAKMEPESTQNPPQIHPKSTQIRSRTPPGRFFMNYGVSGTPPECFGGPFGGFRGAPEGPQNVQGRSWNALRTLQDAPETLLGRLGGIFSRSLRANAF